MKAMPTGRIWPLPHRGSSIKHGLQVLTAIAVAALTFSCTSVGNNFDESKVAQIKKGETTEADLVQLFGKPVRRNVSSNGTVSLEWLYAEARMKGESFIPYAGPFLGGANQADKTMQVSLGPDGKVVEYSMSAGSLEQRDNQVQAVPK